MRAHFCIIYQYFWSSLLHRGQCYNIWLAKEEIVLIILHDF